MTKLFWRPLCPFTDTSPTWPPVKEPELVATVPGASRTKPWRFRPCKGRSEIDLVVIKVLIAFSLVSMLDAAAVIVTDSLIPPELRTDVCETSPSAGTSTRTGLPGADTIRSSMATKEVNCVIKRYLSPSWVMSSLNSLFVSMPAISRAINSSIRRRAQSVASTS